MAEAGWYPDPQQSGWPAAAAVRPPRRREKLLIGAVLVAVLVAAGLGGWQLLSGDDQPALTYQGMPIADPGKVLQSAESAVASLVARRHGAQNGDSRCYFTQSKKTPSGEKKSDVHDNLLCGPVLFVDGDNSKPYLTVPVDTGTSGSKATLRVVSSLDHAENVAVPDTVRLVRPDGKAAPGGAGSLSVPPPPPADRDVLTSAPLGQTSAPPALTAAKMVGRNESVTVLSAGVVPRYGSGDDARSAPDGQQLIAFRLATDAGDIGAPPATGGLTVLVPGGPARKVPEPADPSDYVILATPTPASASLVLIDGGIRQTLALPSGKAGASNILVLARQHRYVAIAKSASVPIHLSNGTDSANVTFHTTVRSAALDFWVPQHPNQHPASSQNALLSVDLAYTDPNNPGPFGWDPQLLELRLPNGTSRSARNIASVGHIFDVFEVPAGFTTGTLEIVGTEKVQGITLTIARAARFTIAIPAG